MLIKQVFARKLLHLPYIEPEIVEKEVTALRKLGHEGGHSNIVSVRDIGELINSPFYFIDMEICDLNLAQYIHRLTPITPSESIPYFVKDASPPLKVQQIWNIVRQIANGLKYMHSLNMVHRDLKPANGGSPRYSANL